MAEGIYVAKRNGQCQHCGHRFFSSEPNSAPLCYHCKSAGRTIETAGRFETYADFADFDADDLRDAAMEHELDDCEVA